MQPIENPTKQIYSYISSQENFKVHGLADMFCIGL